MERRYPDPAVRVLDPRFDALRLGMASVECLYQGARWSEGPVWFGDSRTLVWSDIPNNRMLRWDEETGEVRTFRKPSNNANGNTRDREGRLVTCEHLTRRVTRTEYDGSITVLADQYNGKPLNSPNDVIVKSDGSIWFSDPTFGIDGFYEGERKDPQLKPAVYRVDGKSGEITMMTDTLIGPNGLAFSPDESVLYIVDSRASPRKILAFDVASDGHTLTNQRELIDAEQGTPDGFRVDVHGNLWCGWGIGSAICPMASPCGVKILTPSSSNVAPTCLLAAVIATACSWRRVTACTRFT